jgi:hypothetical protein
VRSSFYPSSGISLDYLNIGAGIGFTGDQPGGPGCGEAAGGDDRAR